MNTLRAELQRLFARPGQELPEAWPWPPGAEQLTLVDPDERVWTLVLGLAPQAGWGPVAALLDGMVNELELPLPAVSLAGEAGFRVWISLVDPVPLVQAHSFLEGLRRRYLGGVAERHLSAFPGTAACVPLPPLPLDGARWLAFIDPAMGSMFGDEPWLEMAPSAERQAELLAGFKSIKPADFARVLDELDPPGAVVPALQGALAGFARGAVGEAVHPEAPGLTVGGGFVDPKSFLLAVMNDPGARADYRLDAAKALLPYFEGLPR
ncbi:MAG: hypothetical protein LWW92_05650 [Rhodocyclales bacterium]|nr:hypothetical protein [Rhodocyclales bacterium]